MKLKLFAGANGNFQNLSNLNLLNLFFDTVQSSIPHAPGLTAHQRPIMSVQHVFLSNNFV